MSEGPRRPEPRDFKFKIKHAFILLTALSALGGGIYLGNKAVKTFDVHVEFCPVVGGYADEGMTTVVNTRSGKIEGGLQTSLILPTFIFPSFELSICKINGIDYLVNKFGRALELKQTSNGHLLPINNQLVLKFDENNNPSFADVDIDKLKELIKTQGTNINAVPEPKVMTPVELKRAEAFSNISLIANALLISCGVFLGVSTGILANNNRVLKEELAEALGSAKYSSRSANETNNALKSARQDNARLAKANQDLRDAYKRLEKEMKKMTGNKNIEQYSDSDN